MMSAVLGETDYSSTGFDNLNIVTQEAYCSGCNGSFNLSFTTTSIGTSSGVFGVGFTILNNDSTLPYDAFITFGDSSTLNVDLALGGSFFGITDTKLIQSISFGVGDGTGITREGYFRIDNLTIGHANNIDIPEPPTMVIFSLGFIVLMIRLFRQKIMRNIQ